MHYLLNSTSNKIAKILSRQILCCMVCCDSIPISLMYFLQIYGTAQVQVNIFYVL